MPMFYSNTNFFGLTWQDWCYLSINKLALRHINDKGRAERERRGAHEGDALSLVIPGLVTLKNKINIHSVELKEQLSQRLDTLRSKNFAEEDNVFNFFRDLIFAEHKKFLSADSSLEEKQDALTKIFNSLLYFSIVKNERSFGEKDHFYMLIAHSGASNPYDFFKYPLGKCGSNGGWPKAFGAIHVTDSAHRNIDQAFSQITRFIQAIRKNISLPDKVVTDNEMGKIYPRKSIDKFLVAIPCTYYWGRISMAVCLGAYGLYRATSSNSCVRRLGSSITNVING